LDNNILIGNTKVKNSIQMFQLSKKSADNFITTLYKLYNGKGDNNLGETRGGMKMYTNFGDFFSAKRKVLRKTLREFCRENGFDAGNISKLERGILPPPQSKEKRLQYASAINLYFSKIKGSGTES